MATSEVRTKTVGGDKNGKTRAVAQKGCRYYPTEDIRKPLANRKVNRVPNKTRLRANITPGTVLILLAGQFRGKRVVFLKQLSSGLLLVSGPFKVNGVPLRRVNQRYVISTKTKVDVGSVDVKAINDEFFVRNKVRGSKSEGDFMGDEKAKVAASAERVEAQKKVDTALTTAVKAVPSLKEYLAAPFRLTSGQYPHNMVF